VVASTVSPLPVTTRESSAERFFQWSLYLLLVTGFLALMGTGKLDLPSQALVIPALLLRGFSLLMRRPMVLPEAWATRLTLVYFAFFAADYFYFSQSFVIASAHMVLFSVVVKIFSVRRDRDLAYLAVLSFMMVLSAVVLTVDTLFLFTFALFLLAAMATFVSLEIRRSQRNTVAATVEPRRRREFYRALAGVSGILGVLTLAGSSLIFFILPRINSAGYLRNFGTQSPLTTGFSQEVRLGEIGRIQQSNAVVMHVQVLSGRLPADIKWRGVAVANFDGQRWWNDPTAGFRVPTISTLDLTQPSLSSLYSGTARVVRQPTLTYRMVLEPMGLGVFFLAPVPLRINDNHRVFHIASDGSVFDAAARGGEFEQAIVTYTAEADTRDPGPLVLNSNSSDYPATVSKYLKLPKVDPRIEGLARAATAGAQSNYTRAVAIETYLKSKYGYTLELPGANRADPLAHFLFERKKGHCEFFASSMAVMLRTLGIPTRVVNGFRGGELNDLTGRYIVRERDAHSWVEVYFPEYGWVTFDPTPPSQAASVGSGWSRVGLYLDAARDLWREWVINYDFSQQVRLGNELNTTTNNMQSSARGWVTRKYRRLVNYISGWQRSMERMSPRQMALACILLALLLALPFVPKAVRSLRLARRRRDPQRAPKSAASFWYMRLLKRLAHKGLRKPPWQTPEEFASSIADPQVRDDVLIFTEHYERARFAESAEDAERLPELFEEIAGRR
jgi:hypothetical protein